MFSANFPLTLGWALIRITCCVALYERCQPFGTLVSTLQHTWNTNPHMSPDPHLSPKAWGPQTPTFPRPHTPQTPHSTDPTPAPQTPQSTDPTFHRPHIYPPPAQDPTVHRPPHSPDPTSCVDPNPDPRPHTPMCYVLWCVPRPPHFLWGSVWGPGGENLPECSPHDHKYYRQHFVAFSFVHSPKNQTLILSCFNLHQLPVPVFYIKAPCNHAFFFISS